MYGVENNMRKYTFTNGECEFITKDVNHMSAKRKVEELQRNIFDSPYSLKLIRVEMIEG